jgi:hypothetical protein
MLALLLLSTAAFAQTLQVTYKQTATVDIGKMPHADVAMTDGHDNSKHSFSCVALAPILASAGVPMAEKLHGPAMSLVVIASAADNYRVAFALPEIDETVGGRAVYVCDRQDGKPLNEKEGPLRLVVPGDKHPSRWVRMVASIAVVEAGK